MGTGWTNVGSKNECIVYAKRLELWKENTIVGTSNDKTLPPGCLYTDVIDQTYLTFNTATTCTPGDEHGGECKCGTDTTNDNIPECICVQSETPPTPTGSSPSPSAPHLSACKYHNGYRKTTEACLCKFFDGKGLQAECTPFGKPYCHLQYNGETGGVCTVDSWNTPSNCLDMTGMQKVLANICQCGSLSQHTFCTYGQYCDVTVDRNFNTVASCLNFPSGEASPTPAPADNGSAETNGKIFVFAGIPGLLFIIWFCFMDHKYGVHHFNVTYEYGSPYCCSCLTGQSENRHLDNEWAREHAMENFGYHSRLPGIGRYQFDSFMYNGTTSSACIQHISYCGPSRGNNGEQLGLLLTQQPNEMVMIRLCLGQNYTSFRLDRLQDLLRATNEEEQQQVNEAADRAAEAEIARCRREQQRLRQEWEREQQEQQERDDEQFAVLAAREEEVQQEWEREYNDDDDLPMAHNVVYLGDGGENYEDNYEDTDRAAEATRVQRFTPNVPQQVVPSAPPPQSTSSLRQRTHNTPEPWDLPPGKEFHFFMCHHQTSGGDAVATLALELENRGYKCWRDNDQHMEERDTAGMQEGVRRSCCLLLFHSGQKETVGANGEAYPDAANSACQHHPDTANGSMAQQRQQCTCNYESPFTRWFCHVEMLTARQHQLPVVVVQEIDDRSGRRGMRGLERRRLKEASQGWDFTAFSNDTTENIKEQNLANKEIVAIPYRRQAHELRKAMLPEIVRQAREKLGLRSLE